MSFVCPLSLITLVADETPLTRGRDCTIIYVPPMREVDQTAAWPLACDVRALDNQAP